MEESKIAVIKDDVKAMLIEEAGKFKLPDETQKEILEKSSFFQSQFPKEKISELEKEYYYQGKGVKQGNFTYELEWNSRCLGGIGGGSVYKFGYEEDFLKIKAFLVDMLSGEDKILQFYKDDGELTEFSQKIIEKTDHLKGIGRVFVGKILSIYYPNVFINIFGHQDIFLEKILVSYQPETSGVELYFRNNHLLFLIKEKVAPGLSNYEFGYLLYHLFPIDKKSSEDENIAAEESEKIQALEVQHYQSLVHRNFQRLFKNNLRYYDLERQTERKGQFDTQEVGIMDILAIDKSNNLIVIELKRESTDRTLAQVLRYMGWVKKNLCKKGQSVKGIILAETKDNKLEYALTITPDVTFRKMRLQVEIED